MSIIVTRAAKGSALTNAEVDANFNNLNTDKAEKLNAALTGVPTAPTALANTSTLQLATTEFATAADNLKANAANAALTGVPTAPTAAPGTSTTQLANTAFVAASEAVAKAYADSLVVGLWDDRGNFDASVNTYPTVGGSGVLGAIIKGDIWTVSVVATAGPLSGYPLGATVRALVDAPAQLNANWTIAQVGIGYVPENAVNKSLNVITDLLSNIKFPSVKAVYDWVSTAFVAKTAATGSAVIPAGTTAQADAVPLNGYLRFNTTLNKFVGWINGAWSTIGGGATGGGTDEIFLEMDAVMTQSKTIGDSTYAEGVVFTALSNVIGMNGHSFVVDSLVHFRSGVAGALPPEVIADTVYRVVAPVVPGVSFAMANNNTGIAVTPSTTGATPNQVGKIRHAIIPNPFVQAAGTVLTVENGTVISQ